jgi:beta-galactosidase
MATRVEPARAAPLLVLLPALLLSLAGLSTAAPSPPPPHFPAAASSFSYPQNLSLCPMQTKLSLLSPFPVSVVWIEQRGDTMESIAAKFQEIRSLGFTALKQIQLAESYATTEEELENRTRAIFNLALDSGLIPYWYETGGWECITLDLLAALGIDASTPPWAVVQDPRMTAHQDGVLRARVANMTFAPYKLGEPGAGNPILTPAQVPAFAAWLDTTYGGNATALLPLWQDPYRNNLTVPEFSDFLSAASLLTLPGAASHDYRRYRDSMRWQADALDSAFEAMLAAALAHDPNEPQRTGAAMLLLNQAYYGWDVFQHARLAVDAGSFYISSHLPWHYSELQHEIDRPVFFSVSMCVDAARGAWPGEWESTGGPSQYSGGFSTSVDAGIMRKLLLTYIGAGMRGIGLWTYNGRQKGQESAEYMLETIQGRPSQRARAAGAVAAALQTWRWELWQSDDEPVVAVLYSWENEAVAGRLFLQTPPFECTWDDLDCGLFNAREMNAPALARMGWARALVDAHVPFTHVDEDGVRGGLLDSISSIRTLVIPHALALSTDILDVVRDWQLRGGRVVADMPFLLMGNDSVVVDQSLTSAADIFGV